MDVLVQARSSYKVSEGVLQPTLPLAVGVSEDELECDGSKPHVWETRGRSGCCRIPVFDDAFFMTHAESICRR